MSTINTTMVVPDIIYSPFILVLYSIEYSLHYKKQRGFCYKVFPVSCYNGGDDNKNEEINTVKAAQ